MKEKLTARRNLIVLALYTAITLLVTYPLVTQFGDHVPGTETWAHDEYSFVWSQWWVKHTLLDQPGSLLATRMIFYPLGVSLATFTMLWLHALLGLPLQFAFGLIPATNAMLLFSFVVSAWGMYLFASYLLRVSISRESRVTRQSSSDSLPVTLSAFVAGLAFAFASNRFVYLALGHYNIAAVEWLPFYLLFLFKTLRHSRWKDAALAGLFAALAIYSEMTDAVLLVLLTAVLLLFEWRKVIRPAVFAHTAGVAVSAAVLSAPLLIPALSEIMTSGYKLPGWGHSENLLVDLFGFITPTSLHPLARNWTGELDLVRQGISRFSDVNTFFVGYVTLLLALVGAAVQFRRVRVWITSAVLFALFSLGPLLHINGVSQFDLDGLSVTFPMPFLALHYIPLIRENRVPNRYSLLVVLALAVLIAYGSFWVLDRLTRLRRPTAARASALAAAGVVSLLLLFEHLAVPIPLTDARVPPAYEQIGKEPGDFAILTLPLGWRNSFGQTGAEDTRIQYYQSAHGKFLLGGNTSRNAPFLFDYYRRLPILSSIIALETYNDVDAETTARDQQAAPELINFFDLRYLVVSPSVPGRPPYSDTRDRTLEYLKKVLPLGEKVYDRDGTIVYKVNQSPLVLPLKLDFGSDGAHLYQGDGWTDDGEIGGATGNWSTRQGARIFIPLRQLQDYTLTLRALPFEWAGHTQTLTLFVNGARTETISLKPGWNEYTLKLPRTALTSGVNKLEWEFGYLVRPSEAIPPNFAIGSTGVNSPIDIAVQSTPEFASIKIAGREVSLLKRGYNLAAIDPRTGALLAAKSFDTGGSGNVESRAMADFISKLPVGTIVAGAVQEDAAAALTVRGINALQSLGLKTDLRGKAGQTHAFIAVKGKEGALEVAGEGPSAVNVGHSTDDRLLGVAFDWLEVQASNGAMSNQ